MAWSGLNYCVHKVLKPYFSYLLYIFDDFIGFFKLSYVQYILNIKLDGYIVLWWYFYWNIYMTINMSFNFNRFWSNYYLYIICWLEYSPMHVLFVYLELNILWVKHCYQNLNRSDLFVTLMLVRVNHLTSAMISFSAHTSKYLI